MADSNSRLVFSTGAGRVCFHCGLSPCRCSQIKSNSEPAALPRRITARLRMEKAGRGGKMVTIVDGLPDNDVFLKDLCQDLKRACGTGGTVLEGAVQLQGDVRERIRPVLSARGYTVKG